MVLLITKIICFLAVEEAAAGCEKFTHTFLSQRGEKNRHAHTQAPLEHQQGHYQIWTEYISNTSKEFFTRLQRSRHNLYLLSAQEAIYHANTVTGATTGLPLHSKDVKSWPPDHLKRFHLQITSSISFALNSMRIRLLLFHIILQRGELKQVTTGRR